MGRVDETLPRYYELAKEEFGIPEVYNENVNMFSLITTITNLITNSTEIKVNGEDINIKDYKLYIKDKILENDIFIAHENKTIMATYAASFIAIFTVFLDTLINFKTVGLLLTVLIVMMVILSLASGIALKINLDNTKIYRRNKGFYVLVLGILEK